MRKSFAVWNNVLSLCIKSQQMNTATISLSLSKVIVKIVSDKGQSTATQHKLGDLSELISSADVFTISGLVSDKKLAKYKQVILSNGFTQSQVNWEENAGFSGDAADAVNFSIIYVKA